jgi:hypothetical protein
MGGPVGNPNLLARKVSAREGISTDRAAVYVDGLYSLQQERDIANIRRRLLRRWREGVDRNILREYRVLYYALGQILKEVR